MRSTISVEKINSACTFQGDFGARPRPNFRKRNLENGLSTLKTYKNVFRPHRSRDLKTPHSAVILDFSV